MKTAIIKASDGIHTVPLVTLRKIASGEMRVTDLECWEPIMRTFVGVYLHVSEAGWISPDVPTAEPEEPKPEEPPNDHRPTPLGARRVDIRPRPRGDIHEDG